MSKHHNLKKIKYQTVGGHQFSFGATRGVCTREGALGGRFRTHDAEPELGGCEPGRIGPPKAQTDWNRFGGVQNQVNSLNSRVRLDGQFCLESPATMPQKLAENCPHPKPPPPPILH